MVNDIVKVQDFCLFRERRDFKFWPLQLRERGFKVFLMRARSIFFTRKHTQKNIKRYFETFLSLQKIETAEYTFITLKTGIAPKTLFKPEEFENAGFVMTSLSRVLESDQLTYSFSMQISWNNAGSVSDTHNIESIRVTLPSHFTNYNCNIPVDGWTKPKILLPI